MFFRLKRYANGKEDLESELYSRFVLVLNEKKAKIRSLQETLKELQEVGYADLFKCSAHRHEQSVTFAFGA